MRCSHRYRWRSFKGGCPKRLARVERNSGPPARHSRRNAGMLHAFTCRSDCLLQKQMQEYNEFWGEEKG